MDYGCVDYTRADYTHHRSRVNVTSAALCRSHWYLNGLGPQRNEAVRLDLLGSLAKVSLRLKRPI